MSDAFFPAVTVRTADQMIAVLRKARYDVHLAGHDLASELGLAKNVVYHWEARICWPRLPNLVKWANALGYDIVLRPQLTDPVSLERSASSAACVRPGERLDLLKG